MATGVLRRRERWQKADSHVGFVLTGLHGGGAERVMLNLASVR